MLSSTARLLAYYGGVGFALALICLALLDTQGGIGLDAAERARLRRRAFWLAPAGVVHPVFALAALVLARDANRGNDVDETDGAVFAASASLTVSLVVRVGAAVMGT